MRYLALCVLGLSAVSLHADEVFVKNNPKPIKGTVQKESAKGVQLAKEFIPAEEIVDIHYDLSKADAALVKESYLPAQLKDKESSEKLAGKKNNMISAMFEYENTLKNMEAGQEYARRNIEFRIAYLRARESLDYASPLNPAIKKLSDFKAKHPDSWQLASCLQNLAELYMYQRDYALAEKCYQELAQAPVSDALKQEAEFLQATMSLRLKNPQQAQARYQAIINKLPKNSKNAIRALVGQAECLALMKKDAEANKIFHQIIKDAADPSVKAMAYNGLGKNFYDQGMLKEARWEFLWVDVAFSQDKAQHAVALYYLWQIYGKLNEPEHAQECLDQLLNDRQFTGLEYQRKAQSEKK